MNDLAKSIDDGDHIPSIDTEQSLRRLERAWKCITDQFLDDSQKGSIQYGEGINVYHFILPKHQNHNCEYYYAEKGDLLWNDILETMPNKEIFLKNYKHSDNFAVCVSMPTSEFSEEIVRTVRIFSYDTHKDCGRY
jgi:hypothetical protein